VGDRLEPIFYFRSEPVGQRRSVRFRNYSGGISAGDKRKIGSARRLRVTGLLAANASIQVRAMEFNGIAVWVNDVDLRVACGGVGTKLHFLQVVVRNVVAETFAAQRR
jgi:hypothetical protein